MTSTPGHAGPRLQRGDNGEREQVQALQGGACAQRQAVEAGEQGHEHKKRQEHGALLSACGKFGGMFVAF